MNKELKEKIKENFLLKEKHLSPYACLDSDAIRLEDEDDVSKEQACIALAFIAYLCLV